VSAGFLKVIEQRTGHLFEAGVWVLANSPGVFPDHDQLTVTASVPENPAPIPPSMDGAGKSGTDAKKGDDGAGFIGAGKMGAGKPGPVPYIRLTSEKTDPDQNADPTEEANRGLTLPKPEPASASGRRSCASSEGGGAKSAGDLLKSMGLSALLGPKPGGPPEPRPAAPPPSDGCCYPPTDTTPARHGRERPPGSRAEHPLAASPASSALSDRPGNARASDAQRARVDRLTKSVLEVAQDRPNYAPWWREACARAVRCGVEHCIAEAVQYARDCGDPVVRARKDLGPLKHPGRYIASQLSAELKGHGSGLPPPPRAPAGLLN
jgi:hypothetical protein